MIRPASPTAHSDTGLTTGKAPFIEHARATGQLYIEQPYDLYSEANHATWQALMNRMKERWARYANPRFLQGLEVLQLDWQRIPRLEDINRFMAPRTGFRAKAVSGYVPAYRFFACLKEREFPTTITIRDGARLDYLPEPDIFHDVAGHVPMHTDPAFAEALVRFGRCAERAALRAREITDPAERTRRLANMIRGMARFFWFTVEFGLMRGAKPGELKVYGSGLLSSHGELAHSIDSPEVQRYPIQLEWVINQAFEIDRYQPLLFIIDSFDHLFELVGELEEWLLAGRLDNVAPGEPAVSDEDLQSFLQESLSGVAARG
jgi:phenylalanine-4-hydroxylase